MNFSLISFQMTRVISSPSSSTTGFLTLILGASVAIVRRLIRVKTETGAARGRDEARKLAEAEFKAVRDQTEVRRRGARRAAEATGDMVERRRGGEGGESIKSRTASW